MKQTLQAMLLALVAIMMPIGAWAQISTQVTIPSNGRTTLYLAFATEIPEGIKAYIVTDVSNNIQYTQIDDNVIPANTGVVLAGEPGTYTFNSSSESNTYDSNLLKGSLYTAALVDGEYVYFTLDETKLLWNRITEIQANKAYIELPANKYGSMDFLCFENHSFSNGVCDVCTTVCNHTFVNGVCATCEMILEAKWGASKDNLTESGTFKNAITAAKDNSTVSYIQLQSDVTSEFGYVIESGTFTLDLNGKNLESNSHTLDFRSCTVTLTDNSENGGGKVVTTSNSAYSVYLGNESANLTIEKGRYEGDCSFVISVAEGQLTISGGEFAAYNTASSSSIVNCNEGASLTITGGNFDAKGFNYAIHTYGTTTISGGTFTESNFATVEYSGGSLVFEENTSGITVKYSSSTDENITKPQNYNYYDNNGEVITELEYGNTYTISKQFKISFAAGEGASGTMDEVEAGGYYILPECTFIAPDGKMFDAWKVGDEETIYQPYEKIKVTGDIAVTAQWTDYKPQIIIRMQDSCGDGWTGNAIIVCNNNTDEGTTYTIESGSISTVKIDYDKTKDYLFYWRDNEDGTYPHECSFQILVDGKEVYSADGSGNSTNDCSQFVDGQLFYGIMAPLETKNINDGEVTEFEVLADTKVGTLTYSRTLPNLTWNALYVPFEIPVNDLSEEYDVAYINDVHSYDTDGNGSIDDMDMEVIKIMSGTLNANYPYLIRAKNESAKEMSIVLEDATLYKTEKNGVSCSSAFMEFYVYGIYEQMSQEYYPDVLAIGGDGSWHKLAEGSKLNPFRLYLEMIDRDGSPVKMEESAESKIRIKVWGEDSNTTGIEENIELGIVNSESEVYDLQGRKVKNPTKGLYIVNGKKVVKN